jgi:type IV pilus assembly protein PilC
MPSIDVSRFQKKKSVRILKEETNFISFFNKEINFNNGQLSDKKKEGLYMELSTLLLSGIDLRSALDLTVLDQEVTSDKELFGNIRGQVLAGLALSDAIKNTLRFSAYEYHSLKIGEETGKLAEVLADLARYYKSKIQQRRKIVSSVSYPVIVLTTSMGAVLFMIKFVVPMFADVFLRFGGRLPWITALIIKVSNLFSQYFYFLVFSLVVCGIVYAAKRKTRQFRKISSRIILKLPVVGDLVKKIYLARFANTMRLLVSTDTPLLRSIALVREMINYFPIETSLLEIEQDILNGKSLHESLSGFSFYPPKMVQLIKIGEEVNRMDYFFEKIATQFTEEVEYKTNTLSSAMEPLIIIFLGVVVGVILIAMYLPMFQMSNSF